MPIKIYLDQGHNPENPNAGAEANGVREQDISYAVGQALYALLEENPDFVTEYARTRDHTVAGREKTSLPKCTTCQQFIYQDVVRDYSGTDGWRNAIYDCCTAKQAKAKYAISVAEKIVSVSDANRKIPPKIKSLLNAMDTIMSNEGGFHNATIAETTTNSQS